MSYNVRVKEGVILGGHARDGARLNIVSGRYLVEKTQNGDLVFSETDARDGGNLVIKKGEYLELNEFPDINENPFLEIL